MGATRTTHPFVICWVDELLEVRRLTGWGEGAVAVPGTCTFGEGWVRRTFAEHFSELRYLCNIPIIDTRSICKFFASAEHGTHIRHISGIPGSGVV